MAPHVERPLRQAVARIKIAPLWASRCLVVALLALLDGCGALNLGSYGASGEGGGAGDGSAGALAAGGQQSVSGYGNASAGRSQSHSTAGAEQTGGVPSFGGG